MGITIFVRRIWPDQVEITVVEKNACCAVGMVRVLLSDTGRIIYTQRKNTYPNESSHFLGPEGKQMTMLQYFNEINRLLTPLHAKISYLELTPYLTWKLHLDNGIDIAGRP